MGQTLVCDSPGHYTVSLNASNAWGSESVTEEFDCYLAITRNWELTTNSPKSIPTGEIQIDLSFTEDLSLLPVSFECVIDFGDSVVEEMTVDSSEGASEWSKRWKHTYQSEGAYEIAVNISNVVDFEIFTIEVRLFEKFGNLTVTVSYAKSDSDDKVSLKGPDETDAPVGANVYFECEISGYVEKFFVIQDENAEEDFTNRTYLFPLEEMGEWSFTFRAWNPIDEYSNNVTFFVRALPEIEGVNFNASSVTPSVGDEVEFLIEIPELHQYSCVMFDGGDGGKKQAFGYLSTCLSRYDESHFQFIEKTKRAKREAIDAEWVDDTTMTVTYQYDYGGQFDAEVEVFNSVSEVKRHLTIIVSEGDYLLPLLWIDHNSTNIAAPIERERGNEFRLETTAIFRDFRSFVVSQEWTMYKIDGDFDEDVNLTSLVTYRCSAIRFPARFLEIGLYKLIFTLTVYPEVDKNETTLSEKDNMQKAILMDDYERIMEEEEEEHHLDEEGHAFEGTPLGARQTFTYLRIIPTPLLPMIIEGGSSYVIRGFGQTLNLEPTIYTIDPDDLDATGYEVQWFCHRVDRDESLVRSGDTYEETNPSGPISDRSTVKEADNKGGCFGKGPGKIDIGSGDYTLKTESLWSWDALYNITAVIKINKKVTESYVMVDLIEPLPPAIILRCEKSVACLPNNEGIFVNDNSWASFRAVCNENCGEEGELEYTFDISPYEKNFFTRNTIRNFKQHIIVDKDRLGINSSLYSEAPGFRSFLVHVEAALPDIQIPLGEAITLITLNAPPEGGTCTISTTSGMALLDMFSVKFADWRDPEKLAVTDFSVYVKYDGDMLRLQYGEKTEFMIVLPYGEVELFCAVGDINGAVTQMSFASFTTSLPTLEETEDFQSQRILERSLAEGKMSLSAQILIALNSVLMHYRKMNNDTGFGVVSEAAIDAALSAYLEQEGIDSSYFTTQARDEIRDDLQEIVDKAVNEAAKKKNKEMKQLKELPMDSTDAVENYGAAWVSVAEDGPTNKAGQEKIMEAIATMYSVINASEASHPEDKRAAFNQFGGTSDALVKTLAEGMLGGNYVPEDKKRAEIKKNYNATEINEFIYFVDGSKKEVEERLNQRAIEAVQESMSAGAQKMATDLKDMVKNLQQQTMKDIMVGEEPFEAVSRNGFQVTIVKKLAAELSGSEIQQGGSSVVLPHSCVILGYDNDDCELNDTAIGVQMVRWTQPLESYGEGSSNLNKGSNVIQIDVTSRDGDFTLPVSNAREPFKLCIPHGEGDGEELQMEYVIPKLEREDDILVYHQLLLESPSLSAKVNIKVDDENAPLIIVYKYENKSALNDYDGIMQLRDIQSIDGLYNVLIDPYEAATTGTMLYIGIGHLKKGSTFSVPKRNLTVSDLTNVFTTNYSIKVEASGCYYFDEALEKWSAEGCKVVSADTNLTCCECNHLTSFGSGFFVPPNSIDFSYVFANAGFATNNTIYFILIGVSCIFIIFIIFARWRDLKDVEKLGASPLPDNDVADKYLYEILVFTGHQRNAGTKSNVFFIVSGEDDESETRILGDDNRSVLQKGSVDAFVMAVPRRLGQLNYLRIWHDNSGKGKWSSWFLKYIIFKDVQTGHKFEFLVDRWFALEEDDGLIDRLIPVAGKEQVTEFSHLFSTASRRNLADNHLWFSIFLRPPRSRFTRVQRVGCCMAVLCLSMLVNAMYYERTTDKPNTGAFKLGPLSLSPEQVAVGLISNFIIFPPTFLMIFLFRKSRPRTLRKSRIEEAIMKQRAEWKSKGAVKSVQRRTDEEAQTFHRKRKFVLPWWCLVVGWILVIGTILACMFFIWAFGIEFGDEKTTKWLTSLVIAFFSSVFITQPLKVILMAIVVSCICRSTDYDDDDADEDEEDPFLANDEEYLHKDILSGQRVKRAAYRPMDMEALEEARKEREKEVKMYSVIREVFAYIIFLWIVIFLSYGNRDPNNYYLRQALINGFIKPGDLWVDYNNVNTEVRFWNWTHNALIPELFAFPWYNGRRALGLRLFLDDRNNFKIGYAVMRQVRIQPKSCTVSPTIEVVTSECAGFGSMFHEDGTLYTKGWKKVESMDVPVPPEYKYLTASQLKGYPFWGQIDWYGGGGYVVPLHAKTYHDILNLAYRMMRMERNGWIDRHTRAVFVEIATYNAQVNLFCAITIVAEFVPGGGVIPYYHIDPLRLLNYHTGSGLIQILFEIAFVLFTIFFTVCEIIRMGKEKLSYFSQYWNIAELASIIASYVGIFLHVYKLFITAAILKIFTETEGSGYVKLQEAVLLNEAQCYIIGFIMSVATLKFLKLLRFNKRIGVLNSTLRRCAEELQSYSVCLMIVFIAFVILFWMLLGRYVREFSTFIYSFESSISMMLKKFNYEDMHAASPIFTPIAFFTFSLATAIVLINILLTIIIRSFEDVKKDEKLQSNEYEIFDFFINRLKMVLGCGKVRVRPMPSMYKDTTKKKDAVDSFNDKVDSLVNFINSFYFEDHLDFNSKEFLKKMNAVENSKAKTAHQNKKKTVPNIADSKSHIPMSIQKRFDDF